MVDNKYKPRKWVERCMEGDKINKPLISTCINTRESE